jgi:hypothetical protein
MHNQYQSNNKYPSGNNNVEMPKRYSSIRTQQHQKQPAFRNQSSNHMVKSSSFNNETTNHNTQYHQAVQQRHQQEVNMAPPPGLNKLNSQHIQQSATTSQSLQQPASFYYMQPNDYVNSAIALEYAAAMAVLMSNQPQQPQQQQQQQQQQIYYQATANQTGSNPLSMAPSSVVLNQHQQQLQLQHHQQQQQLLRQSKAIPIVNPHQK